MEENKRVCDICGCVIEEDAGTTVGERLLCEECVSTHCTTCDHCGEIIWITDAEHDENTTLCRSCYEDSYHHCEGCGRLIHDSEINWRGDYPYCDTCYDEFDDEIEDYSYKPEPVFYGDGNRYLGVELEVDEGGRTNNNAETIKNIANIQHNHIYIKNDGSLSDGFEIVSHPMTLEYHMKECDWEAILNEAISLGYLSHQTNTCGLHVHVNRDAFGDNQSEQEEVISKILFLIEKHWNEVFRFSRRSTYNMNRWASRYGYERTGKEILKKAKESSNGRYCAINLCNYNTIEFRLFRGTLKYNTFMATLQFVDTICDVALSMSQEEIEEMSWSQLAEEIKYPELIQYLKERRLYVNERVYAEEDM